LYRISERRLAGVINSGNKALLKGSNIGLEKESLRVSPEGNIAQTPHPTALGAALTHPYITTDYSEALVEFITPPFGELGRSLSFLRDTQKFVYDNLVDEILWATSMPCVVAGETSIPIAQYGTSNAGTMKTVYRRGLGHRYGRVMQVIAGVHFNFSFPEAFWPAFQELEGDRRPLKDFISDSYFALIRNLQRVGWLVPYLFGASPAVCKSFLGGRPTSLHEFNESTYYEPYGTSLRMGDIGYQNNKEHEVGIKANYDGVDAYVDSLSCAISTPYPGYQKIGVVVDGEYQQLNANILQIENEYYSTVRPKQILEGNEKPSLALKRRGVRYIELRSLDVNAFDPLGINEEQIRFLEALAGFCLFHDSPRINDAERRAIDYNEIAAAHRGRDPALKLRRDSEEIALRDWALELCTAMEGFCELLDEGEPGRPYTGALELQKEAIRDPDRTPSARMLAEMRQTREGFYHFARRMSHKHQRYFQSLSMSDEQRRFYAQLADKSIADQRAIEASDDVSFGEYLERYFAQR
jgi:glutamate--cysteine ligase